MVHAARHVALGRGLALLIGFAIAVAGCASNAPPPWISGASPKHPTPRWLVAVGRGANAEAAARDGLARIARQTTESSETAAIAETWKAPDGEHWALAVMDLAPIRTQLGAELTVVETKLQGAVSAADAASPDQALLLLDDARALDTERSALRARIAALGGPVPEVAIGSADLERRLSETRKLLPIEIEAFELDARTGEADRPLEGIRRALAQKVIALGFPVSSADVHWGDDPTWLVVRVLVGIDRLQLHPADRLVAMHWDASLEITDRSANDDLVAVLTDEGRATHLNETEASREAREDAEKFAAAALEKWLRDRTQRAPEP